MGNGTLRALDALDPKTSNGRDVALVRERLVERDEEYEEIGGMLRRLCAGVGGLNDVTSTSFVEIAWELSVDSATGGSCPCAS